MLVDAKTLEDVALSWAVCRCEDWLLEPGTGRYEGEWIHINKDGSGTVPAAFYDYANDWDLAGPIIFRERISVGPYVKPEDGFHAYTWTESGATNHKTWCNGPTPLTAAMRCYVANKLGSKVEVPDALIKN